MIDPQFQFVPYVGALPIAFGMGRAEVASLLGEPAISRKNFLGEPTEYRWENRLSIMYYRADETVVEMGFAPGLTLGLDGVANLLDDPDLIEDLIRRDPDPQEALGFLVFLGLGLATTGFHDHDPDQRAITVFAKGRWDGAADRLRPYRPSPPASEIGEGAHP